MTESPPGFVAVIFACRRICRLPQIRDEMLLERSYAIAETSIKEGLVVVAKRVGYRGKAYQSPFELF